MSSFAIVQFLSPLCGRKCEETPLIRKLGACGHRGRRLVLRVPPLRDSSPRASGRFESAVLRSARGCDGTFAARLSSPGATFDPYRPRGWWDTISAGASGARIAWRLGSNVAGVHETKEAASRCAFLTISRRLIRDWKRSRTRTRNATRFSSPLRARGGFTNSPSNHSPWFIPYPVSISAQGARGNRSLSPRSRPQSTFCRS